MRETKRIRGPQGDYAKIECTEEEHETPEFWELVNRPRAKDISHVAIIVDGQLVDKIGANHPTSRKPARRGNPAKFSRLSGWYAVEPDAPDYYNPPTDAEGPHETYSAAAAERTKERSIVRWLHDDGYLYIDEQENPRPKQSRAGTARRGNPDKKIKRVLKLGRFQYGGSQVEKAVYAEISNGQKMWIVGYGGDYVKASKDAVSQITDVTKVPSKDDGSWVYEIAERLKGSFLK